MMLLLSFLLLLLLALLPLLVSASPPSVEPSTHFRMVLILTECWSGKYETESPAKQM